MNPPCSSCANYFNRHVGSGPKERQAPYAWCKARSVFNEDDPDKPEGAKTTKDPVAKPFIVYPNQIVLNCPDRRDP